VEPRNPVSDLINCLTEDEDYRQELWVHYLSGNPPSTFADHLQTINNEYNLHAQIQQRVHWILKNPPSDRFYHVLENFSDIEQSVICLLTLGLTVPQVSGYKGIDEVRIRQVVAVIREHGCWEETYGTQEKIDRCGKVRSQRRRN
jgi:hypothetical protein